MDSEGNTPRRMVRVEDVAREAGVSPITVSRALSHPHKVREETRKRVEAAVAKTGYVVNRFASSLRSGHSSIISVFVSSLANPQFAQAIQGAADALEGSRYHLLMAQTGNSDSLQDDMLAEVLPFRPAAIMFTSPVQSEAARAQLRAMDMPVVEMWELHPDPIDMLVGFSGLEGGRLLGEHFAARGYRRVAYVGRTEDRGGRRLEGFSAGLGRTPELVLPLETARTINDGMQALETTMAMLPDCDAVLFGSDLLAVGALLQARKMGIDIPTRLALAGYGDLEFSRHVTPSITSLHVSAYDMGFAAGGMLLRRLQHEAVTERVQLSPIHLEVRASTGGG